MINLFEQWFMHLYRFLLRQRSQQDRLDALGTCDTFDFSRQAARRGWGV